VALIDDVITTGSTVNALAAAVRSAGASAVSAWGIARTPELGSRRFEIQARAQLR
jgi:predicted amidophosphoribosyltransferase